MTRWIGMETIYGDEGDRRTPYLTRLWIGRLRLHIFHRGDADPDYHDHPWDFWTFPLTSYVEEVVHPGIAKLSQIATYRAAPGHTHLALVQAFRLHYRRAEHCHRLIGRHNGTFHYDWLGWTPRSEPRPQTGPGRIITIVWRGRGGRKWGFVKNRRGRWCWVPWRSYVDGPGKHAPCDDTITSQEDDV